jgi:hypothetical protein
MTITARCLACQWTVAGTWATVDRGAERHTRVTKHATVTLATP